MTTTITKDEALVQMTMRWLEAEARLQQADVRRRDYVIVMTDVFQKLREQVLERTHESLKGTIDRLFAEALGKERF